MEITIQKDGNHHLAAYNCNGEKEGQINLTTGEFMGRLDILEPLQKALRETKIANVIQLLKDIDVDGETMQHILEQVCMEDQMLKQLMLGAEDLDIENNLELREELQDKDSLKFEWNQIRSQATKEKAIAKKVWDDFCNNDTLTFNTFEEYWNYIVRPNPWGVSERVR
jgi:hypothetical protein